MKLLLLLPHKQIGWREINEDFIRFTLFKTPWIRIYLHRLDAPTVHEHCHDHPWDFVTLLLRGGYNELHDGIWTWRKPGSILFRAAEFRHNVVTRGASWSLVVAGRKRRSWGFTEACS